MEINAIQKNILHEVANLDSIPQGAYNIRANGESAARNTTANIDIVTKKDKPGIDIIIKPGTKGESVHIPVVLTESGLKEMVYNDFYIGEGADVTIVAGCGISNCGDQDSEHDGIHSLHVEKNARVYGFIDNGIDIATINTLYDQIVNVNIESSKSINVPGKVWNIYDHATLAEMASEQGKTLAPEKTETDLTVIVNGKPEWPVNDDN